MGEDADEKGGDLPIETQCAGIGEHWAGVGQSERGRLSRGVVVLTLGCNK